MTEVAQKACGTHARSGEGGENAGRRRLQRAPARWHSAGAPMSDWTFPAIMHTAVWRRDSLNMQASMISTPLVFPRPSPLRPTRLRVVASFLVHAGDFYNFAGSSLREFGVFRTCWNLWKSPCIESSGQNIERQSVVTSSASQSARPVTRPGHEREKGCGHREVDGPRRRLRCHGRGASLCRQRGGGHAPWMQVAQR